jgi:HK97 family phage prohead protease
VAKYDHIDFTPPAGVRDEAARGLAWRGEFNRGGTAVGVARARDLSNGTNISPETARRMKAYFDRHEVDKQGEGFSPGENGFPSAGRIAWALWGGDPGQAWANKLVRQMNAADEEGRSMIERRSFCDEETTELPLLRIESRADEAGTESRWIVGYAAKFGVNSLDLGEFTERIDPGAFGIVAERRGRKKPLETRALWNHDPNYPLARYPGTLRMNVDETGLRYEFPVPDTSYGRDLAANIEAGIVRGSSFSFQIAPGGESWSVEDGRSIRTVTKIDSLIDVGPVTFPAYPDADVTVAKRSYDSWRAAEQEVRQQGAERLQRVRAAAGSIRDFLRQHGR